MSGGSLSKAILRLEGSSLHWAYFAATFLGLVVARNLLEGALGPGRVLGFTYFASPSALMVLDHFLLFYVSLFLSFSILLSVLAREDIGRVMKVITPAWVLVLIPPVLDFLGTGGQGKRITYILELSPVILRFFDPTVELDRISTGQRVEILAACVLAAAYLRVKGQSWFRALAAFIGVYLLVAAHGVYPSAFARLSAAASGRTDLSPLTAYDMTFKSGGLILEESRKLALLFLYTSIAFGWVAFRMRAPMKAAAICSNFRPLRTLHYLGMAVFGVAVGWAVFVPAGVRVDNGGDFLGLIGVCAATLFAFQASVALNDLFDQEGDRIAEPGRPLVTGVLDRHDAAVQVVVFSAVALLAAFNVKYACFLLMVLALAFSLFYSAPPIRLKRFPILATLTLGLISLLTVVLGFSVFAEERAFRLFPARLGWLLVLSFGMAFTAKDLKDVEADRATGVWTFPVLLGMSGGRVVIAVLLLAGYLLVPLLLPYGALVLPAIVLGILSGALVFLWKRPRVDNVLLVVYLIFALLVAIVVSRDVDVLLENGRPVVHAKAQQFEGRRAEAEGRWSDAAEKYVEAGAVLGDDPSLLEHAGVALFNRGRMREAAIVLSRALQLNPTSSVGREYLAVSHASLGDWDMARKLSLHSIENAIRAGIFLKHLGGMDLEVGDAGSAEKNLSLALRVGESDVPTAIRYADALTATGNIKGARCRYEAVVGRNPESAEARDALGRFYHSQGEADEALGELRRAVALAPDEALYWNNLAVAHRDLGQYDQALAALDEAVRLSPRLVDAYYNRGKTLDALGRHEEARAQYLLALEIDPAFTPAREALEQD